MADTDRERADLNALIRQAHETMADLAAAEKRIDRKMQEANEVAVNMEKCIDQLEEGVHSMMEAEFRGHFEQIVETNVTAYNDAWIEAVETAKAAIFARFDLLFAEVVGGNFAKGFPSIAQEVTRRMT